MWQRLMLTILIVAGAGFVIAGLLVAFGVLPFFVPVMFWLLICVWMVLRAREQREERQRLLDRIAERDW